MEVARLWGGASVHNKLAEVGGFAEGDRRRFAEKVLD